MNYFAIYWSIFVLHWVTGDAVIFKGCGLVVCKGQVNQAKQISELDSDD
jgi:hypothetical protein